jgi:hypothetical protein
MPHTSITLPESTRGVAAGFSLRQIDNHRLGNISLFVRQEIGGFCFSISYARWIEIGA